jgi:hypothetical protein
VLSEHVSGGGQDIISAVHRQILIERLT